MAVSRRFIRVWQRNLKVYRKIWKISFLPPLLEPVLYLLAFGVGLSALVGDVVYLGVEYSYMEFIAPALIAITIMYEAFFENSYASFVRMYYQKTFDAMLATPLFIEEIITGEIIWGATKSVLASTIMLAVISLFGLLEYPDVLAVVPTALLGGLAFGAFGMFFTSLTPSIEMFNLPIFLIITPMFLFGGTFFPLETLPVWAQHAALILPLTHVVLLVRHAAYGIMGADLAWSVLYLVAFTAVFFPLSIRLMRRRLIK